MIPPGEIARLAHRLGLGDKTIEQDYVLTWILLAIAHSPLRDQLAFKGGTALKKIHEPDYRFSEDLDFTLLEDTSNESLVAQIEALFPWLRREGNIVLGVRQTEVHETGSPAIYLNYVGPLRGDMGSRLTGRYVPVELFPFSFAELMRFRGHGVPDLTRLTTVDTARLQGYLDEYLRLGVPEPLKYPELPLARSTMMCSTATSPRATGSSKYARFHQRPGWTGLDDDRKRPPRVVRRRGVITRARWGMSTGVVGCWRRF